jgi:CDGSH-type Zn-finger protein
MLPLRETDGHLAIVLLAKLAVILAGHTHRVFAFLWKAHVADDPVAAAIQSKRRQEQRQTGTMTVQSCMSVRMAQPLGQKSHVEIELSGHIHHASSRNPSCRYHAKVKLIKEQSIMTRIVKREHGAPYSAPVSAETEYICGCGLPGNQPVCDVARKAVRDEPADKFC